MCTMVPIPEGLINVELGLNTNKIETIQLMVDIPYRSGEVIWGITLFFCICIINCLVLWVIGNSKELWDKPRHLWMACLCVTDLFVAAHKALELFIILWPLRELCILKRTTLGIPYVVNVCLLFLLSLDRFVAVHYPFFYSNNVTSQHVVIGFFCVIVLGLILTVVSTTLGLQDKICRPQPIQLVLVTVILTICSVLIFLCNTYVLRIAKKQINAIHKQNLVKLPGTSRRPYCVKYCQKLCRQSTPQPSVAMSIPSGNNKDASIDIPCPVNGLDNFSVSSSNSGPHSLDIGPSIFPGCFLVPISIPKISGPQPVVLAPAELNVTIEIQSCHPHETTSTLEATLESHHLIESLTPLSRAISLPSLPKSLCLVIPTDPTVKTTAKMISSLSTETVDSKVNSSLGKLHSGKYSEFSHAIKVSLPRSRSFTGGKKFSTLQDRPVRHNFLKSFHLTGAPGLSHAWRLLPSLRFSRTVLIIMIPMWLFLAPIVIIIPMQKRFLDQGDLTGFELDCEIVNELWIYLQIHMRSILPIQAVLDTLIYACSSKEFRRALKKCFIH